MQHHKTNLELVTRLTCGIHDVHLKFPQAANVIAAFKADRLQAFINADLDCDQTSAASSDHRYTSSHCRALVREAENQKCIMLEIKTQPTTRPSP